MSSVTFGGLATGLDTESIIDAIMAVEREPLTSLETEQSYLESRLEAFSEFEEKLEALADTVADLDTADEVTSYSATAGSDDYFSLSIESSALASTGTYHLEVVNLAQVQKDVSVGYAETSSGIFTGGTITIGTTDITIADGSSLNSIREAINDADDEYDTGVTASIIHDGTNYRMVLTGEDAETDFSLSISGISDGTTDLSFSTTQEAEQAEILVDGITITSGSNSISDAIPGVSIDLLAENTAGETTSVSVDTDFTALTEKLETFATAYNAISSFISDQEDADWGKDQSFRSVQSKLRSLLVTDAGSSGTYSYLAEIGFETDSETGLLSISSTELSDALDEDFDSIKELFVGSDSTTGIMAQFTTYLEGVTDSIDGIYAAKQASYDSRSSSIEEQIERMEWRLEKREATLLAQFTAMETLVSSLNTTASYLSQLSTSTS